MKRSNIPAYGEVKSKLNVVKLVIKEIKLEKSGARDILHRKYFRAC